MQKVFSHTEGLLRVPQHYCPGCTHGVIHRMIGESLVALGIRERTLGIAPVGCAVMAVEYFNCDMISAAHGRAPAVATGAKRARPEMIVFAYQGDGDLASIGLAEIVHAANRGEKITVIFVNNAIYGMTGGQMAPTTLANQHASTCVGGRNVETEGHPMRVSEMLATLATPSYIERVSTHDPSHTIVAKRAIQKAFALQQQNRCFSFVEVLSTCPTNWGLSTKESDIWLERNMLPYYPLGVFKDVEYTKGEDHGR